MKERIENSLTLEDILSNKKYSVNYYQREYRWGRKQVEQLIEDLTNSFDDSFDREKAIELTDIEKFDYYYMGTIIVTGSQDVKSIIDGQQRLTSMSLLLIALNNLHKKYPDSGIGFQDVSSLIYSSRMNKLSFNINVEEWNPCLNTLYNGQKYSSSSSVESVKNICLRYDDLLELLEEYFSGDGDKISLFACWLVYKTIFIKITTPSEQDAHKVFVSMNDRGLSLNTSEMLKGYLLSEIKDDAERSKANDIWKDTVLKLKQSSGDELDGSFNTEDVNFLSTWIRAKYAQKIREGKKDAKDQDYEIIGREVHEWVRQNHSQIGLVKSDDFKKFITVEFKFYAEIYLRLKKYSNAYTAGFEEVFYNADKDLNYQYMFIISALNSSDSEEIINKKIKLVAAYIDCYSARRLFNFAKLNWNTNKSDLFSTIKAIRGLQLDELTVFLTYKLRDMDLQLTGITEADKGSGFSWNQFTGRYILGILARFTDYVDVQTGNQSLFDSYVNRKVKNSYDREHVIPDKFEDYRTGFASLEEFNTFRWKLGNLILLKLDKNRSYQDMAYVDKRKYYLQNNIIAQSFHEDCYQNNPKFLDFCKSRGYAFKPYSNYGKNEISERQRLYQAMALDIWSEDNLKKISGMWSIELEEKIESQKIESSTKVNLVNGKLNSLTSKKPVLIEYNGNQYPCAHYVDVALFAIKEMDRLSHEKLVALAQNNFSGRLFYVDDTKTLIQSMRNGKDTDIKGVAVELHGSGKDLGQFIKALLDEFEVTDFSIYIK